jgi:hypothetical protein
MSHDVRARNWSGAAPVGKTNAAPSEHESPNDPSPPRPLSALGRGGFTATEPDVSPPRSSHARDRATDLMKATVPLPSMAGLIICALAIAAVMWRLEARLDLINERIEHNKELIDLREKSLEDRFKMLEAKIEAAGLRNSAMILSQELAKSKER